MSKVITVQLDEKSVEVKKLPILRYAEMLKEIKELPKHLGGLDFQKLSVQELIEKLPFLLSVATPDIINIISIATELPKEELETLGLAEITDLVLAIAEVNNYHSLFDKAKKALAQKPVTEPLALAS